MTLIVRSSTEDVLALPTWLMNLLNLHDGEAVKTVVEGQTLKLTSVENFLSLRGALAEDQSFDEAIAFLQQAWEQWKPHDIVSTPTSS